IAFVGLFFLFFRFYGKLLSSMMRKKHIRQIASGKLSDKQVLRFYRNYEPKNAKIYIFFAFPVYFVMKNTYAEMQELFYQEALKRNLDV
ncbi:MAG: hypothetical protein ACRCTA_07620, partial [Bacilli bacterium]